MPSIRTQIRGGFLLAAAVLVAVSLLAGWTLFRWRVDVDWVVHTKDVIATLEGLFSAVADAESGYRGYIITGSQNYLEDHLQSRRNIQSQLASLRTLTRDNPAQQQRLNRITPLLDAKLQRMSDTIELRRRQGMEEPAAAVVRSGQGKQEMDRIRSLVGEMRQAEESLLAGRVGVAARASSIAIWTSLIGSILTLLLGGVAWRSLERSIRANEAAHAETVQATQLKSAFLSNMSHELRTPLNTIIGYTELLQEEIEGALNQRQQHFLSYILKDSLHLLDLVNEVLDLSKIEAGHVQLALQTIDLTSALNDVIASVQPACTAKSIALQSNSVAAILNADPLRFKQILLNLLNNAVKFTPSGGAIQVDARPRGEMLDISVADTGPGISKKDQQWVFDPFYQTELTRKGLIEGTGLGLAITRRLVEQHGGRIHLESDSERGCVFTISFPLVHPRQS